MQQLEIEEQEVISDCENEVFSETEEEEAVLLEQKEKVETVTVPDDQFDDANKSDHMGRGMGPTLLCWPAVGLLWPTITRMRKVQLAHDANGCMTNPVLRAEHNLKSNSPIQRAEIAAILLRN